MKSRCQEHEELETTNLLWLQVHRSLGLLGHASTEADGCVSKLKTVSLRIPKENKVED